MTNTLPRQVGLLLLAVWIVVGGLWYLLRLVLALAGDHSADIAALQTQLQRVLGL